MNRAAGPPRLEEDAMAVVAQRQNAGHLLRRPFFRNDPGFNPERDDIPRDRFFDRSDARALDRDRPA